MREIRRQKKRGRVCERKRGAHTDRKRPMQRETDTGTEKDGEPERERERDINAARNMLVEGEKMIDLQRQTEKDGDT